MCYQPRPQQVGEIVLDIINKSHETNRPISEFEKRRIEKSLTSLQIANEYAYNVIAVCYYSEIADIDSMLSCANVVLKNGKSYQDLSNAMIALLNSMRLKDVYDHIYNDSGILRYITADVNICKKFLLSIILFGDGRLSKKLLHHEWRDFQEVDLFFARNDADRKDMQLYISSCFDIFSRQSLPKLKKLVPNYIHKSIIHSDEICEFLHFYFEFKINKEDFDVLIDIEDEYLSLISEIDCQPLIEMKVSFSFELEKGVL